MEVKQHYNTKARKYILEYLENNSDTTVTAADISTHLFNMELSVNPATVYRYLNRLAREKKIIKFSAGSGTGSVYQLVKNEKSCDEHIHIQCIKCGKLIHLDCHFMDDLKEHLEKKHSFQLKCKGSILYGICDSCTE